MSDRIVVVGGGIAGLVCATELVRAGRHVLLVEREREVGGRVRTMTHDGFTLDRGFQVVFEAYPTLQQYADLGELDMRWFTRGAQIIAPGRRAFIGDALSDPTLLWPTLRDGALTMFDLWRLRALRVEAMGRSVDDCFEPAVLSLSTREYLTRRGMSTLTIDRFFVPFYGGIQLDRTLSASASTMLFTFKMLAEGRIGVPAKGMGALPARMASALPPGRVRTGASVSSLVITDGAIAGVRLADGSVIEAGHVVLATEAPAASTLAAAAGITVRTPEGQLGATTVYFTAEQDLLPGRALWLNAMPNPTVSHAVTISHVAPEYGANRTHLIAAFVVGDPANLPDDELLPLVIDDVFMLAGKDKSFSGLHHVKTVRVPYAQFPQPPRPAAALPAPRTDMRGLWLSGEALHSSSLEGAAQGGLATASAILAR
jgi:phytoene dehydrogenase-like protein